jgi:hypothetical protein
LPIATYRRPSAKEGATHTGAGIAFLHSTRPLSGRRTQDPLEPIAATDVDAIVHPQWAAIHVRAPVLSEDLAGDRVGAVDAVVAGPEVYLAVDDGRGRFGVASGLDRPQLLSGAQVQAVELAVGVIVKSFADVDAPVPDGWRGEDRPLRLERPVK